MPVLFRYSSSFIAILSGEKKLELRKVESWAEPVELICEIEVRKNLTKGNWIVAHGLTDNKYDDVVGLLDATDLENPMISNPMFILHRDGYECVVNTPILEIIRENGDLSEDCE